MQHHQQRRQFSSVNVPVYSSLAFTPYIHTNTCIHWSVVVLVKAHTWASLRFPPYLALLSSNAISAVSSCSYSDSLMNIPTSITVPHIRGGWFHSIVVYRLVLVRAVRQQIYPDYYATYPTQTHPLNLFSHSRVTLTPTFFALLYFFVSFTLLPGFRLSSPNYYPTFNSLFPYVTRDFKRLWKTRVHEKRICACIVYTHFPILLFLLTCQLHFHIHLFSIINYSLRIFNHHFLNCFTLFFFVFGVSTLIWIIRLTNLILQHSDILLNKYVNCSLKVMIGRSWFYC